MDLKPALSKLEECLNFKEWNKKNRDAYLSYAFKIPEEMNSNEWQFGFYNKKKDKITTFVVKSGVVNIRPEEEVFKKESVEINEVQLDKVKIDFDSIIIKASQFQEKNFPNNQGIKTIAILQNIPEFGNIWNITYIIKDLNTLNMKIDAVSGKVLFHKLAPVFSFVR